MIKYIILIMLALTACDPQDDPYKLSYEHFIGHYVLIRNFAIRDPYKKYGMCGKFLINKTYCPAPNKVHVYYNGDDALVRCEAK